MNKPRHQKTSLEMDFDEFVSWATSHILFGIAQGIQLRQLVRDIIDHSIRNEVFGGGKRL